MKNFFKILVITSLACVTLSGCGKIANKIDDLIRGYKPKPPRHLWMPKKCSKCEGEGYYWYNGYKYKCSHCNGKGVALEQVR